MKKLVVSLFVAIAMIVALGVAVAEPGFNALVMVNELGFYAEPDYASEVLYTFERMEEFIVCAPYERNGDFVRARKDNLEGWIPEDEMTTIRSHIVSGTECSIYTSPSSIFATGSAEPGEVLLLVEEYEDQEKGGFYVVLTADGSGFISKMEDVYILELVKAYRGMRPKNIEASWNASVYSQPDLESTEIGEVKAGETLEVVEEYNGYFTILFEDRYGYVKKNHVY